MDSGADFSMVRDGLQTLLQRECGCSFSPPTQTAQGAGGEPLDIKGVLHDVPIVIQNRTFVTPHIAVVSNLVYDVVLGRDFCCRFGTVIDDKEGILRIDNLSMALPTQADIRPSRSRVVLATTTVIPARTMCLVRAHVEAVDGVWSGFSDKPVDGVVEPNATIDREKLLIPREVVSISCDGTIPVQLTNLGPEEARILKGTDVGTLHTPVRESEGLFELCDTEHLLVNTVGASDVGAEQESKPPTPQVDVNISDSDLSEEGKVSLQALVTEYSDIFSRHSGDIGRTHLVEHSINTGDASPIKQQPRRIPGSLRDQVEQQKAQMMQDGIIEESDSPWCSPVVLARKKDGTFRFCVDLRAVNNVTKFHAHPLPRVDAALDTLAGARWFTTLDMASGYWQVGLAPDDREKTAFSTGKGLHQFRVMAMGLKNASGTFQRLMELILAGLDTKSCLVYLDDIILFNKTESDHLETIREVFERIRRSNLKLKPQKCFLARREVTFLGHSVSSEGVRPDPRNIDKVLTWPLPTTDHEMHSFLGLCGYYARFIKGYAELTRPLRVAALSKGMLHWTGEMQASFKQLRSIMASPPVLALPSFKGSFVLYTDACNASVGAVLAERVEGEERVIAYDSKALTKQEAKWSTYDKELWAIVHAIRRFRQYTMGSRFEVVTDHKPLQNIPDSIAAERDGTGRRGRWAVELSSYDFEVTIKPGAKHTNADALSRRPATHTDPKNPSEQLGGMGESSQQGMGSIGSCIAVGVTSNTDDEGGLPMQSSADDEGGLPMQSTAEPSVTVDGAGSNEGCDAQLPNSERHDEGHSQRDVPGIEGIQSDVEKAQLSDPNLRCIRECCESNTTPVFSKLGVWGKFLKGQWGSVSVKDGLIGLSSKGTFRILLPLEMRSDILILAHEHPTGGHMGQQRTKLKIKQRFLWPGMGRDINSYCEGCIVCQRRHRPAPSKRAPMVSEVSSRPFERIAMDVTEMPLSSKNNRYALVIMDYFSKYVRIYPMQDQKTESILEGLLDWVYELGVPGRIHSDQGRQFESNMFQSLCQKLGIHKTRTTPYHPESDGMVERFNRTLKDMVAKYVNEEGLNWDANVKAYSMAFNSSVHSTTGYSPYFLVHGFEPRLPLDAAYGPADTIVPVQSYLADRLRAIRLAFQKVQANTEKAAASAARNLKDKLCHVQYELGDKVWVRDFRVLVGGKPKLGLPYKGPMTIVGKVGEVVYKVIDGKGQTKNLHHNHLKPVKPQNQSSEHENVWPKAAGRREKEGSRETEMFSTTQNRNLQSVVPYLMTGDRTPTNQGTSMTQPAGPTLVCPHDAPIQLRQTQQTGETEVPNQGPVYGPEAPYRTRYGRLSRPVVPYEQQA